MSSTEASKARKRPRPVPGTAAPKARKQKNEAEQPPSLDPATTPYDGTLALSELGMPGQLLFAFLMGRKTQLGHTFEEMSKYLGVSAGHLQLLRSGNRDLDKMESQLITKISEYLGVPPGHLRILVGKEHPEDYGAENIEQQVEKAVAFILSDFEWGKKAPRSLKTAPMDLKQMVVQLYEKATGRKLVPDLDRGEHFAIVQNMNQIARDHLPGATKGTRAR